MLFDLIKNRAHAYIWRRICILNFMATNIYKKSIYGAKNLSKSTLKLVHWLKTYLMAISVAKCGQVNIKGYIAL